MKKIILILALLFVCSTANAQVRVKSYLKRDGTFVPTHIRTLPNSTTSDNYSTKGNFNPYSGKKGTRQYRF